MSFAHVAEILDPADFVIFPHVAVLDEFEMTDDDGNVIARIDAHFIAKTVERMNYREQRTGDLACAVIGHTIDEMPKGDQEVNGPPLIGYARNWVQDAFFDTGKTAAFVDFWILKSELARASKFPRRSGEIWLNKHEVDPISFLGATVPCRDLGMLVMKMSRNGTLAYQCPTHGTLFDKPVRLARTSTPTNRESDMADPKTEDKGDEKQTGAYKELAGKVDSVMAMVQTLVDKMNPTATPASPAESPAAAAAPGDDDQELTDEEIEQMLKGGGEEDGKVEPEEEEEDEEKSRKGEKVEKQAAGYAGGDDTQIKLARLEEENAVLRSSLARREIKDDLILARDTQGADVDPSDEKLITNLSILPPDVRKDFVLRLSRKKSISASTTGGHAKEANDESVAAGAKNRVTTEDDKKKVMKLARESGGKLSWEEAAKKLGYHVGA